MNETLKIFRKAVKEALKADVYNIIYKGYELIDLDGFLQELEKAMTAETAGEAMKNLAKDDEIIAATPAMARHEERKEIIEALGVLMPDDEQHIEEGDDYSDGFIRALCDAIEVVKKRN